VSTSTRKIDIPMARIVRAAPRSRSKVSLEFADGVRGTVDFAATIRRGGVLRKLADPSVFRRVRIGFRGTFLAWPGEIDFCADALWLEVTGKARPISGDG
jgi:hypothetical protein